MSLNMTRHLLCVHFRLKTACCSCKRNQGLGLGLVLLLLGRGLRFRVVAMVSVSVSCYRVMSAISFGDVFGFLF